MKNIAEHRCAAGNVIDGAIRDVAAFAASDLPCFARAVIHRGPIRAGRAKSTCRSRGLGDSTRDIVVGGEHGVVSFPFDRIYIARGGAYQIACGKEIMVSIREGPYQGSDGKS
jgi:regulator of RNase E activity RraA